MKTVRGIEASAVKECLEKIKVPSPERRGARG